MKACKKNLFLVVLSFVAVMMAVVGFSGFNTAKAEGEIDLASVDFVMEDVQVRLDGRNGMRFVGSMSANDYEAIIDAYGAENVEAGLFFMPAAYAEKVGEINEENTFGGAKYVWGDEYKDTPVVDGKYRILHTLTMPNEVGENYKFYGSIHGFLPENMATDYIACAYVKVVSGENVEYKFAADQEAISMLEVAYKSIGLYDEESEEYAVLEGYETSYVEWYTEVNGVAPQGSYTVKYVAGSEVISTDEIVVTDNLIEDVSVDVKAPRGYILADGQADVVTGKVKANSIELIVNIVEKPVIDLTSQCIDGTIGILAYNCDTDVQQLELPIDIGGVYSNNTSFLADFGWEQYIQINSYDAENRILKIDTAALQGTVGNYTSERKVFPATIEGTNAIYEVQVMAYGWKHKLITLSTAEDVNNKFSTSWKDASVVNSHYYDYVFYSDIEGATIATGGVANNTYSGVIDGRGHTLKNTTQSTYSGMIDQCFTGTLKNLAIINMETINWSNNGIISPKADGAIIENVYINGWAYRECLFATIGTNGVTLNNVVLNFTDGYGQGLIKTNYDNDGALNGEIVTNNLIYANEGTKDANANFFTNNLGQEFGSFVVRADGLYFNGKLILQAV